MDTHKHLTILQTGCRPDMVLALDPAALDRADLAVLAEEGFTVAGGQWQRSERTTPQGAPEDPSDMA